MDEMLTAVTGAMVPAAKGAPVVIAYSRPSVHETACHAHILPVLRKSTFIRGPTRREGKIKRSLER